MQNLSNTEYHAHPAIGASGLRLIDDSPAMYYATYLDPNCEPVEKSDAMKLGSLIHTALLEPHLFDDQYACMPDGLTRQSKAGKEAYDHIISQGKEVAKIDDVNMAKKVSNVFHSHPLIMEAMDNNPIIEKSFIHTINGVQVKIKPDIWIPPCKRFPNGNIIDPKSTQGSTLIDECKRIKGASKKEFSKSINEFQYYLQSSLYANVLQQIYELPELPPFRWFAQETTYPYLNKPYRATDMIQQYGWDECLRLLDIYQECQQSGVWPGYGEDEEDAELPIWKQREITASEGEIEVSYVK